jgi:hypothetical protein
MPGITLPLDMTLTKKNLVLDCLKETGDTKTPKVLVGFAAARSRLGDQKWRTGRYGVFVHIL